MAFNWFCFHPSYKSPFNYLSVVFKLDPVLSCFLELWNFDHRWQRKSFIPVIFFLNIVPIYTVLSSFYYLEGWFYLALFIPSRFSVFHTRSPVGAACGGVALGGVLDRLGQSWPRKFLILLPVWNCVSLSNWYFCSFWFGPQCWTDTRSGGCFYFSPSGELSMDSRLILPVSCSHWTRLFVHVLYKHHAATELAVRICCSKQTVYTSRCALGLEKAAQTQKTVCPLYSDCTGGCRNNGRL